MYLSLNDKKIKVISESHDKNILSFKIACETKMEEVYNAFSTGNLSEIKLYSDDNDIVGVYTGYTIIDTFYYIPESNHAVINLLKYQIGDLKKGLDDCMEKINDFNVETNEIKAAVYVAKNIAYSFDDQQALSVKYIYDSWEKDPEGYEYSMENQKDKRRTYKGRLWNLKESHKKQSDWFPGAEGTLWSEVVEGHDGTIEDPIPVPDSVTTSGFEYEYGKYYIESDIIYLAKRQGKEDGEKETLYFFPSALIGSYFEKISN